MRRAVLLLCLLVPLVVAGVVAVRAQSGGDYDLAWNTVDGGGGSASTGGGFSLGGSVGQPDAAVLAGGGYTLSGGFWGGGPAGEYRVYLPQVVRQHP